MHLSVRDNRWQFSFGSKYMVIADVLSDPGDVYVAGGIPINLSSQDPQVKSTRAPWFMTFQSNLGYTANYVPSDMASAAPNPPSTVLANANSGYLQIFDAGVELAAGDPLNFVIGNLQAMCVFQGME